MENQSKFEHWWENHGYFIHKDSGQDVIETTLSSWDACKQEILNIIKSHTKHNFTLGDIIKMTEEIEKL